MNFRFRTSLHEYERKSIIFIFSALVFVGGVFLLSLLKRGVFKESDVFFAFVEEGQGLSEGAPIKVSGRVVGYLNSIKLRRDLYNEKNRVELELRVFNEYSHFLRRDSLVLITRENLIGEKQIEISGGEKSEPLGVGQKIQNIQTLDLIAIFQSKTLFDLANEMGSVKQDLLFILREVTKLAEEAQKAFAQFKGKNMPAELLSNTTQLTRELNTVLKEMRISNPSYVEDFSSLAKHLNSLSKELQVLTPVLREAGPELPKLSRRLIEALDESVVLVKALQKNYFLKGAVIDVKKSERERDEINAPRKPASQEEPGVLQIK